MSQKESNKIVSLVVILIITSGLTFSIGYTLRGLMISMEEPEKLPPIMQIGSVVGYVNESIWNLAWYGPVNSTSISGPTWHNDSFIAQVTVSAHFSQDNLPPYAHVGFNASCIYPEISNVTFDGVHAYYPDINGNMVIHYSYGDPWQFTCRDYLTVYFFGHGSFKGLEGILVSGIIEFSAWWIEEES